MELDPWFSFELDGDLADRQPGGPERIRAGRFAKKCQISQNVPKRFVDWRGSLYDQAVPGVKGV